MIELATTARSAEDAARSLDCELGSIVKSLVFSVGPRPVLAPVAGDRRCRQNTLGRLLGMKGTIDRADADTVRGVTGFSIGGVPPVAHCSHLPTVIDASLWRFSLVYAAAGHPHWAFPETPDALARMTGGIVSEEIALPT